MNCSKGWVGSTDSVLRSVLGQGKIKEKPRIRYSKGCSLKVQRRV